MSKICAVSGCDTVHFCKGYCRLHFERWRRHGNPLTVIKALSPRGVPMQWLKDHAGHTADSCLTWPFAKHEDGRAHMNGKYPARVMCELVNGPPPTSKHEAAHSCGKGHEACVNPQHLRWATAVQNAADKFEHGTVIFGEGHYGAKLDVAKVIAIRGMKGRMTQQAIANAFDVQLSCVNKVINRKTWRHVP